MEATPRGIRSVRFGDEDSGDAAGGEGSGGSRADRYLELALAALRRYLAGQPASFDFPFDFSEVTPFQARIYEHLVEIPHGQLTTYGALARKVRMGPGAARAVGQAVGANPIPIFVPCHRVVRSDGRLGGYTGGLERKVRLLELEGIEVPGADPDAPVHPGALRLPL